MLQNVEFTQKPPRLETVEENSLTVIRYNTNIRQITKDDDVVVWLADVYTQTMEPMPGIFDRIDRNYEKFLAKAIQLDCEAQRKANAEAAKLTMEDLTEMTADQEFRICMLELGVDL